MATTQSDITTNNPMYKSSVEYLINTIGVLGLLRLLAKICHEKEVFYDTDWQDKKLAYIYKRYQLEINAIIFDLDRT